MPHRLRIFLQRYDDRFVREYGFLRPVVPEVVQGFLRCGDLSDGFARVLCPDCHHEYLLTFSCRGRWFCPSCHAKKVILFGQHLRDNVLYPVPHRQYVFSIPSRHHVKHIPEKSFQLVRLRLVFKPEPGGTG